MKIREWIQGFRDGEIWIEPKHTLVAIIITGTICCIAVFYVVRR